MKATNTAPYSIDQALTCITGSPRRWMRAATILPSDAMAVAASASASPRSCAAELAKPRICGQNTSATPATPMIAATMVVARIGWEKNTRMPTAFIDTTSENTTATRPEVRSCSAR